MKLKSFNQFLNEFEIEGEVQSGKPLWNGKDYLGSYGINLRGLNLTELPCRFPEVWQEDFNCYDNNLTSLQGTPKVIKGDFNCSKNQLTSLDGVPKEVGGNFSCGDNRVKFTKEDIRKVCEVGGKIYV